MLGLSIYFTAGRFHATPWGRHVNEAAPEWPPSPWRLLRSLVATWKRKIDDASYDPLMFEGLFRKISTPPIFVLPPATTGHTRHFMPWHKEVPTLVFDSFVALDKAQPVSCLWPDVTLNAEESDVLTMMTANLNYLGRAESWTEVRMLTNEETSASLENRTRQCIPLHLNYSINRDDMDAVRVLCADPDSAFSNEKIIPLKQVKGHGKHKQEIHISRYTPNWHLCMETLELHDKRWSDPPGSTWVTYLRCKDCFALQPRQKKATIERPRPTMARYAIDGNVLPLVEDTLKIAESARRAAMGKFSDIEKKRLYHGPPPENAPQPYSEVFSGKDEKRTPLEGHRHAYFLPTDEDGDGRIDHLTIIAAMGFGTSEVKALDLMRRLKRDQGEPLNLLLLALGQASEIRAPFIISPSRVWKSYTPFITTRYPKARGQKRDPRELLGLENQKAFAQQVLKEELQRLRELMPSLPEPTRIEPLNDDHRCGPKQNLRPIQFKRYRQKTSDDGGRRPAGAFRIIFPEPVSGPICLGHSAHFGLGMFVPEDN